MKQEKMRLSEAMAELEEAATFADTESPEREAVDVILDALIVFQREDQRAADLLRVMVSSTGSLKKAHKDGWRWLIRFEKRRKK